MMGMYGDSGAYRSMHTGPDRYESLTWSRLGVMAVFAILLIACLLMVTASKLGIPLW